MNVRILFLVAVLIMSGRGANGSSTVSGDFLTGLFRALLDFLSNFWPGVFCTGDPGATCGFLSCCEGMVCTSKSVCELPDDNETNLGGEPSPVPISAGPSATPSSSPSAMPTPKPQEPAGNPPISKPTTKPTLDPSSSPSFRPSPTPISEPTAAPIQTPSLDPPTRKPSPAPTDGPTMKPSASPTDAPTMKPSPSPTNDPTRKPSTSPTDGPTREPSPSPTNTPTKEPSPSPTNDPTLKPSPSPTDDPTPAPIREFDGYSGSDCAVTSPDPETFSSIVRTRFFAFGDTPYDEEVDEPFEGPEYECLQETILPGIIRMADDADFVVHVGDIKKGNDKFSQYCNDNVFSSRRMLFETLENDIDFLLIVGDNEWNECKNYNSDPSVDDPVKTLWREYFVSPPFANFDRASEHLFSEEDLVLQRQSGNPENFFFYYDNADIAVFGITEPKSDDHYDSVNAEWVSSNLSGKNPKANLIFGHSRMSSDVRRQLDLDIPTLYVRGESHSYCMRYYDQDRYPKFLEVTVDAYDASPLLISVAEGESPDDYYFYVEKTEDGCS